MDDWIYWTFMTNKKVLILSVLLAGSALALRAQPLQFQAAGEATPTPVNGDQTTWKRVVTYTTPYGKAVYRTNKYEQIGSSLNYLSENGWTPSVAEFEIFEGGAIGRRSQHQIICSPNANDVPMLDVLAAGKRFRTRVMGIVYSEPGPDGRSVLVGETQPSVGQLLPSHDQILYTNAFDSADGINADLIIIYTKAGWEQNVVFRIQPPDPREWGLTNARIELWTEQLFDTPEPVIRAATAPLSPTIALAAGDASDADATELHFGGTMIGPGTAFLTGAAGDDAQSAPTVAISKAWVNTPQNRRFLVESAPYVLLRPLLSRLPQTASINRKTNEMLMARVNSRAGVSPARALQTLREGTRLATDDASRPRNEGVQDAGIGRRDARPTTAKAVPRSDFAASLPPLAVARKNADEKIQLAKLDSSARSGVTMDYSQFTVSTNLTNWIFRSDSTTLITDEVDLQGTTVLEGGCVLKFSTNAAARLVFYGPVSCVSDPWHPVTCTAKDDDVYGEQISGSLHSPTNSFYGGAAYFDLQYGTQAVVLHDIKALYASVAFKLNVGTLNLDNAQILYGDMGFRNDSTNTSTVRNALFFKTAKPFYSAQTNAVTVCEHLTVHQAGYLIYGSTMPDLLLTNSLVISVTNGVRYSGANVQTNLDDTGIFTSAGQGVHYLPVLSQYRGAGNTNVSTNVIASLQMRTTTAPIILSNNVDPYPILSPVVPRGYSTAPDLGFASAPIDFLLRGIVLRTNTLLLTNGVNVAVDCSFTNFGILLGTNGTLISDSDPLHLNRIVRSRAIQELPVADKAGSATFADAVPPGALQSVLRLRFTDLPLQASDYHFIDPNGYTCIHELTIEDCQVRGGVLFLSPNSSTNYTYTFWNNLFERVGLNFRPYAVGATIQFRNNLFFGGALGIESADANFYLFDDLFDQAGISADTPSAIHHDYNGYITNFDRLTPYGLNDVVITNANVGYQTGLLSRYFLPSTSPLIDAGSQTADYSGLYWYCSTTNQALELFSPVNIGLHFVALGTNNLPLDGDMDSLSSFREDANGNGSVEPDETNPNNAATFGINDYLLVTQGRSYKTNSAVADTNNLINLRVYTPLR